MTSRRAYWLNKAIVNLDDAYQHLSEAIGLIPENESFDETIDEHQRQLDEILQKLRTLTKESP